MHQGDVNVVAIPADYATPQALAEYAAFAHALGMSVMWELSNQYWWQQPTTSTSIDGYFQKFITPCGCKENGQLLSYIVHFLAGLPGTYGYYAADDSMLGPGDKAGVARYIASIRQQDPVHTLMIASADPSQTHTYQGMADLIGTEIYPVFNSSEMPVRANEGTWGSVADEVSQSQKSATRAGKQSAFILQAFTWGDNLADGQGTGYCTSADTQASCYAKLRYPSTAAQLQLRNEVLQHAHPKLILWWSFQGTFGQAGDDTYSLYPTGAVAASRWAGLSAAIRAPFPGSTSSKRQQPKAHAANARIVKHSRKRHHRRRHHGRRTHRRHHRRFLAYAAARD
jgi:hypothetical protein